ncbi:MAG: hypothetical protein KGI27_09310 [Thaumarchaeota archaeon]|nr:hypothetical protein [Nitrososphaerota archaeon]
MILGIIRDVVIPHLTRCDYVRNSNGIVSAVCDLTTLGGTLTDIGIGTIIAILLFKIQADQSERLTKVTRNVTEKVYSRNVEYYTCDIQFDEPEGTDPSEAERRARERGQKLVDEIKHDASRVEKIIIEGRGDAYHLTLKEGTLKITLPVIVQQNFGTLARSSRIHIQSTSFAMLDKILSVENRQYWDLQWHVTPKYDIHNLISKILEATGKSPSSKSGTGQGGNTRWDMADYPISPGYGAIVIRLAPSYIALTYQNKPMNGGFYKAHKIFLPEKLVSILFGEVPITELREMIKQSLEP